MVTTVKLARDIAGNAYASGRCACVGLCSRDLGGAVVHGRSRSGTSWLARGIHITNCEVLNKA